MNIAPNFEQKAQIIRNAVDMARLFGVETPLVAVLEQPDHAELLEAGEREALTTWVVEGAVPDERGTHPAQWNDPRTDDWHGQYLRDTDWQPIVDPARGDACGLCHAGSPAPVSGARKRTCVSISGRSRSSPSSTRTCACIVTFWRSALRTMRITSPS